MPRKQTKELLDKLRHELNLRYGEMTPEIFTTIIATLGGMRITFPNNDHFYRMDRDRLICKEFNGQNYAYLASKYRLSIKQIRKIINCKRIENRNKYSVTTQ